MIADFRAFLAKGNVLNLAVAVIIGAAFATIVGSLTDDVIMPVVGWLFGGLDFSSYFILLGDPPAGYAGSPDNYAQLKAAGVPMLAYGRFLTVVVNFIILAFIIFLMVRAASRYMREAEAETAEEILLLRDIRDQLTKH